MYQVLAKVYIMWMWNVLYVSDESLKIGFTTKQRLLKLDLSDFDMKKFYQAVRTFYYKAALYAEKWLPLKDDVLIHAKFLNFSNRKEVSFQDVAYFIQRYYYIWPRMKFRRNTYQTTLLVVTQTAL